MTVHAANDTAALDWQALWDFRNPALSEERFRAAQAQAHGDTALILQTQVARTWGLRRDFVKARALLAAMQSSLPHAGAEVQVRYALEWGRSWASATHRPEELTPEALREARAAYQQALSLARKAKLDGLAVDAIHMFAFIDRAPADQLRWGEQALQLITQSHDPAAKRWEASVRNNVGHALHELGRLDEALVHLRAAVSLRETMNNVANLRVAHWMVARTLRAQQRWDDARAIQERLERDNDADGTPDAYVYEELELIHRAQGRVAAAERAAAKRAALKAPP